MLANPAAKPPPATRACSGQRRLLHATSRLCLAAAATRFPALADGLWLLSGVGTKRYLGELHGRLRATGRELVGRQTTPSTGIIGSQSVKITTQGGFRGFDGDKKVNWVDAGYRGKLIAKMKQLYHLTLDVVKHPWSNLKRGVWLPKDAEPPVIPTA